MPIGLVLSLYFADTYPWVMEGKGHVWCGWVLSRGRVPCHVLIECSRHDYPN